MPGKSRNCGNCLKNSSMPPGIFLPWACSSPEAAALAYLTCTLTTAGITLSTRSAKPLLGSTASALSWFCATA
jgi:hypothetical protein